MNNDHMIFLQAAAAAGMLLLVGLVVSFIVFILLFNTFNRIFSKQITNPDPLDKEIIWIKSMFLSFILIAAVLFAVYKLLLEGIVFL